MAAGKLPARDVRAWSKEMVARSKDVVFAYGAAGDGHVYFIAQDHPSGLKDLHATFVRVPAQTLANIVGMLANIGAQVKMPELPDDAFGKGTGIPA